MTTPVDEGLIGYRSICWPSPCYEWIHVRERGHSQFVSQTVFPESYRVVAHRTYFRSEVYRVATDWYIKNLVWFWFLVLDFVLLLLLLI